MLSLAETNDGCWYMNIASNRLNIPRYHHAHQICQTWFCALFIIVSTATKLGKEIAKLQRYKLHSS